VADNGVPEKPGCVPKELLADRLAEGCRASEASRAPEPIPDWLRAFDPSRAETIDVRLILAERGEPFAVVMAIVTSLPADARLIIEAPFNPLPLRRVPWRGNLDRGR
jgi:hypothetical protein